MRMSLCFMNMMKAVLRYAESSDFVPCSRSQIKPSVNSQNHSVGPFPMDNGLHHPQNGSKPAPAQPVPAAGHVKTEAFPR